MQTIITEIEKSIANLQWNVDYHANKLKEYTDLKAQLEAEFSELKQKSGYVNVFHEEAPSDIEQLYAALHTFDV